MTTLLEQICETRGIQYISSHAVSGGDINRAYAMDTTEKRFFIKLNSAAQFPGMFGREAEGLKALADRSLLKLPAVVANGELQGQQYLLLEWLEKAAPSPNFWETFAQGLAQLHKVSNTHFGWSSSNYIGSLVQQNVYSASWSEFYATMRIMPLVESLLNQSLFSKSDVLNAEKLCVRLPEIFPSEPPSLLHGDLWAGNFMAVKNGVADSGQIIPSIYDPAVYFGHREMDLGMSLLFGGFDKRFYEAYHSFFPLEKSWRKRVSLTQLYPLLVHAVLFCGSYINQCRNILSEWGT